MDAGLLAQYVMNGLMLGMMYANGTGTPQDYAEAGNWWAKAAANGHALAAQNLARVPGRRPAVAAVK